MRIAMWSGPRNISTAMMRAFENRPDTAVWDEPFYGAYLEMTGADHPMRDEIAAGCETDPEKVARRCAGPVPDGKSHWYLKHMPHHMTAEMPLDWATDCVNIHLIRHPARVVASYAAKRDDVTFEDIGFGQQDAIYERFGGLVIDSADIRNAPKAMLTALCEAVDLEFDPSMLDWPKGGNASDGPWAAHWYGSVHASTGFAGPEGALPQLSGNQATLASRALPFYEKLHAKRLIA